ncbi:hypothetical protein EBL89_12145 [Cereibacter sphaeroides]|uniref:hypothetical protein n=1 Tax=Cereibacter sphaeroides TaxID=1063 RepID=UPI000F53991A|nr:hypothetical protein [Cereibacter sphaeroides]AZB56039.1 hypothetical protein EBL89_12145 [Cereibacter sphaeroides]AZB60302.1 hypothetical protein EBL88_12095 [Cereibacter sphaeroides]
MAAFCHSTPRVPSSSLNRRTLLSSPLALAVFPATAEAAPRETPVLRLFRRYEALDARIEELPGDVPEEVINAAIDELYALERTLEGTPSQCALDIVVKVAVASHFGLFDAGSVDDLVWKEARTMLKAA